MKNKRGNVVVIAIIVVIVAITAGVIGFLFAKKIQAPATEPSVVQPVVQKSVTQPADETADWKTYTNTQYGFEFKYPDSVTVKESNTNDDGASIFYLFILEKNMKYGVGNVADVMIPRPTIFTPKDIKTDLNSNGIENIDNITSNYGVDWKCYIGKTKDNKNHKTCYSVLNGNVLKSGAYVGDLDHPFFSEADFNKMLSTFKFTNTVTDETADWKTYVNDSYGLSFKYPKTYTMDPISNLEAGTLKTLKLFDTTRPGNPTIEFLVPDGVGGGSFDIIYDTEIENGKIVIKNRKPDFGKYDTHAADKKTRIEFKIGYLYGPTGSMYDSKYSATSGNGISVWFSYNKSEDYEQELKDIISSITITKPEIYGKK